VSAISEHGKQARDPSSGRLLVVATPIGNLDDISVRAVNSISASDVIACEDTRRTRKLLAHLGVTGKRLVSVFAGNERSRVPEILRMLASGDQIVLVSDAGTPGISDPGCAVVDAAISAGFSVSAVPGPSAVVTALAASGIPHDRFCFEGFLPRKGPQRARRIKSLASDERAAVIFEAPNRLVATLEDLCQACGPGRQVAVARELTKIFEEVWRGDAAEVVEQARERARTGTLRGECVIVIAGCALDTTELSLAPASHSTDTGCSGLSAGGIDPDEVEALLRECLAAGATRRDAASEVAAKLGVPKRTLYQLAAKLQDHQD
jgi:16S rRNA (cytidine1402-2'-O)-methyltransferase